MRHTTLQANIHQQTRYQARCNRPSIYWLFQHRAGGGQEQYEQEAVTAKTHRQAGCGLVQQGHTVKTAVHAQCYRQQYVAPQAIAF